MSYLLPSVEQVFLPLECAVCGQPGASPCGGCISSFRPAGPCPPPPSIDRLWSLLCYEGSARELLARLKYRNARACLCWLADAMSGLVLEAGARPDVICWVPTTPARRRRRGFDQAELLARRVARRGGWPARRLLLRGEGPPQTGLGASARASAPSIMLRRSLPARCESVLVVDDVITTGASLQAAAAALRSGGAVRVDALTAGRTRRRTIA